MSSLGTPVGQATIIVEKSGTEITRIYDKDDQCMKATIASFEIFSNHGPIYYMDGPQVVLHLREFSENVQYTTQDGTEIEGSPDKEIDTLYLAIKSVLTYLHAAGCVGKDTVTFQLRRGSRDHGDLFISSLFFITLGNKLDFSIANHKQGIISRTYAFMNANRLCMYLNDTTPATLEKLDTVLAKHFPRTPSASPALSAADQPDR